jgi:tetratricopeptide (TPR) repeat protein
MLRSPTRVRAFPVCVLMAITLGGVPSSGAQKAASRTAPSPLSLAKAELQKGDLDATETSLWNVLSTDPANSEALTMLGVVRGRQKRYPEAEALFRRVLQVNPKSIVASRNLASAFLAQNKLDDAIAQYKQAIQLAPQDVDLRIEVAQLDLAKGNFTEALSTLEGIKADRFPPSAVPLKASSLLGLGRASDADALIPLVKSSTPATLDLARVFVEANDPDGALKTLNQVRAAPKSVATQVQYLRGRALQQKGESSAAMASLRQALVDDPKSVQTLLAMAETSASQNKHAESFRTLEEARALAPDSSDVLRHLIVEAMRSGQNDRALQAAQELQRKSSDLDDRYLVASVMLQQKQFVSASHILEDYVVQRPLEAKAYLGLGIAYLNLLRYGDARQALEHSLQINPGIAEAEYQLGVVSGQQGNRQEAVQHWEKAVNLQPHHAQALFSLGTSYLEAGELDKAESNFDRSLAADPNNMKTEYDLALVLNKAGKLEEAKQHFERYRQMQEAEHSSNGNPPDESDHP